MAKVPVFYSINENQKPPANRVHHNNSACLPGRDIPAHADRLRRVLIISLALGLALGAASGSRAQATVSTQQNGLSRTGEYSDPFLQPSVVGFRKFGKVWEYPVTGFIYAQPLLVDQVHTRSSGIKNVVLVATASNYLYAFAADGSSLNPLWTQNFGLPMNVTACSGYRGSQFSFGILGTPVLDGTTLYLVAETKTGTRDCDPSSGFGVGATHVLYAVDITSGQVLRQSQPIGASVSGFNSNMLIQRPGLAFVGGKVLMAFGSVNDIFPYNGWVLAYDATTMALAAQFCTDCSSATATGAGIWQGGNGIAVDGSSNAYVMTGNNHTGSGGRGDSFIKLNSGLLPTASYATTQPVYDLDLGSSGPILIPGTSPSLLVGGGKEGKLYLLNTTAMTLASPTIATVYQYFTGATNYPSIGGAPVYRSATKDVYVWAGGDYLRRVHLDLTTSPPSFTTVTLSSAPVPPQEAGGASLALSVNSTNPNQATNSIVWAVMRSQRADGTTAENSGPATLRAIDAATLKEIWRADKTFAAPKTPTLVIGYGRVYVSTFDNKLLVFGQKNCMPPANPPCRFATVGDFDGDGKTNIAVVRPGQGCSSGTGQNVWFVKNSSASTTVDCALGDKPVPGDYNGDGKIDPAVWQSFPPYNWNANGIFNNVQWGTAGDIPVPADYDGDGKTDIAIWRPSSGVFWVRGQNPVQWGQEGDIPVPADYDGDGKADFAVWRPSNGVWYIKGGAATLFPGLIAPYSDYIPVPCDYNGDGHVDKALWHKTDGTWIAIDALTGAVILSKVQWGATGDVPVPGDYNGDGKCELATWRPSTGEWFVLDGNNDGWIGMPVEQWGSSALGDILVPTAVNAGHP